MVDSTHYQSVSNSSAGDRSLLARIPIRDREGQIVPGTCTANKERKSDLLYHRNSKRTLKSKAKPREWMLDEPNCARRRSPRTCKSPGFLQSSAESRHFRSDVFDSHKMIRDVAPNSCWKLRECVCRDRIQNMEPFSFRREPNRNLCFRAIAGSILSLVVSENHELGGSVTIPSPELGYNGTVAGAGGSCVADQRSQRSEKGEGEREREERRKR
ncbi:hypothetical protein CRG98_044891 [Punica granatum]|uniref:Uncharacterized protein n=1 Tax=Punica granatum TaxID=22663 RepID=A0A2I0HSY5_PUNGR|nr:hypothetical protein CRG98_044891 [Punica granatum]